MKIAILGAMSEEITPLLAALPDHTKSEFGGNTYYFASYAGHELVIAYSKIGKVHSALTTCAMVMRYGCEVVLFTGVAGALAPDLHIKDLIFATKTAHHDLDITAFGHPHGFVPGREVFEAADEGLNKVAQQTALKMGIELKSGVIVSGDQFICDDKKKAWIAQEFGAAAVEMEGAAVGQVCTALNVPFFILRAISDEAGGSAEMDFDKFVVESAEISAQFLLNMVEAI